MFIVIQNPTGELWLIKSTQLPVVGLTLCSAVEKFCSSQFNCSSLDFCCTPRPVIASVLYSALLLFAAASSPDSRHLFGPCVQKVSLSAAVGTHSAPHLPVGSFWDRRALHGLPCQLHLHLSGPLNIQGGVLALHNLEGAAAKRKRGQHLQPSATEARGPTLHFV